MLINGYSDLTVSRVGVRNDFVCNLRWGAHFYLSGNAAPLFPLINGTVKNAKLFTRPPHVEFIKNEVMINLYERETLAGPFTGKDHANVFVNRFVRYLNELYDEKDGLTPNYKIHDNPLSIVELIKVLPGTNCGKCGYPTCIVFSVKLRSGEAPPEKCPFFPKPISVCKVYPVLGKEGFIETTFSVENYIAPGTDNITRADVMDKNKDAPPYYDRFGVRIQYELTKREIQVLRLMTDGASNPEISRKLNISKHTVKSHVVNIFNKLNVDDRTQAAVWAVKNNMA